MDSVYPLPRLFSHFAQGYLRPVKIRKLIQRRLRYEEEEVNVSGDVNAALSANVNEPGPSRTHVSTRQRVVQRSGRRRADEWGSGT
jgi:ribosomal protein L31E